MHPHNPYGQARKTVLRYYRPHAGPRLSAPSPFESVIGTLVDECQYKEYQRFVLPDSAAAPVGCFATSPSCARRHQTQSGGYA